MFHRSRSLSLCTATVAATCAAAGAFAQSNVRDADAFPCAARERRAVVQDQQGFSITNTKNENGKSRAPMSAPIPLGARLKLDSGLFAPAAATVKEASNASRR